jgi:hypothetical protein
MERRQADREHKTRLHQCLIRSRRPGFHSRIEFHESWDNSGSGKDRGISGGNATRPGPVSIDRSHCRLTGKPSNIMHEVEQICKRLALAFDKLCALEFD